MIHTSEGFIAAVTAQTRSGWRAYIDLSGVTVPEEIVTDISITEYFDPGDAITIGAVCADKIVVRMRQDDPPIPVRGATVTAQIGLDVEGTQELVAMGKFYIEDDGIQTRTDYTTITLTAYSGTKRLERPYIPSVEFPASIEAVAEDIASQCGLDIDPAVVFDNIDLPEEAAEAGHTCKELVGYIAGLMGTNARTNRAGELTFSWYKSADFQITREIQFMSGLDIQGERIAVTGIISGTAEEPITAGAGESINYTNPYMTQAAADQIIDRIGGFEFVPTTISWRGNPAIEAGDLIGAEDKERNLLPVCITEQRITLAGGLIAELRSAQHTGDDLVMPRSPTGKKIQRVYTGLADALHKATEQIKGERGGYFLLETDNDGNPTGWVIQDTPTREPFTRLWRFNQAGLAYSDNGGATYSNIAITMDGAISANAITAGTMSAERIAVENYGTGAEAGLTDYIRFDNGTVTIGRTGSEIGLKIEADKISFIAGLGTDGETTVAYFGNNSLEILDVARARFGAFGFVPRASGNLTFTKLT